MKPLSALWYGLLYIPSVGYWAVQKGRESAYKLGILRSRRAPISVVSVGNLLLGGSGKTPFVIYLADLLHHHGLRPAIVSRGYRGRNRDSCLVVGDGHSGGPLVQTGICGDEPFLMAERLPHVPVLVGRVRLHPVTAAKQRFQCDVAILDDGFQHLPLERDADIVLLNGSEDRMFPAGRLRESFSALRRADVAVLVGQGTQIPGPARKYLSDRRVFRCVYEPIGLVGFKEYARPEDLHSKEVILVSGIAGPDRLRRTAEDLGWNVREHKVFPDHHCFSDRELRAVLDHSGGFPVIFTEKDWVKLPEWIKDTGRAGALKIAVSVQEEDAFLLELFRLLGPSAGNPHFRH